MVIFRILYDSNNQRKTIKKAEAVKHPKNKESHEGIFDPVAFDVDGANSELFEFIAKSKKKISLK